MERNRFSEREVRSLYEHHGRVLTAYACSFGLDFALAQDAVHHVFLKILRGEVSVPAISAGYLYRAVRNTCLNHRRDGLKEVALEPAASWLVHRGANRDFEITLQSTVQALPEEQREVVIMHIWGGLTLQEVADATSTSLNTAASRYRYALAKLRNAFGIEEPQEGGTAHENER